MSLPLIDNGQFVGVDASAPRYHWEERSIDIPLSLRGAQYRLPCHCEERSDVAIS